MHQMGIWWQFQGFKGSTIDKLKFLSQLMLEELDNRLNNDRNPNRQTIQQLTFEEKKTHDHEGNYGLAANQTEHASPTSDDGQATSIKGIRVSGTHGDSNKKDNGSTNVNTKVNRKLEDYYLAEILIMKEDRGSVWKGNIFEQYRKGSIRGARFQ